MSSGEDTKGIALTLADIKRAIHELEERKRPTTRWFFAPQALRERIAKLGVEWPEAVSEEEFEDKLREVAAAEQAHFADGRSRWAGQ